MFKNLLTGIFWLMLLVTSSGFGQTIEKLTFAVPEADQYDFIRIDQQVWTHFLARQPGFIKKEVTTDADQVILRVYWQNRKLWKSIPKELLDSTDQVFLHRTAAIQHQMKNVTEYKLRLRTSAEEFRIDLTGLDLDSFRKDTLSVDDPVFHRQKRYQVIPTRALLEAYILTEIPTDAEIVFHCRDDYSATCGWEAIVTRKNFLVVRDLDNNLSVQDMRTPEGKSMGPFYFVWPEKDLGLPWPWAVEQVAVWW